MSKSIDYTALVLSDQDIAEHEDMISQELTELTTLSEDFKKSLPECVMALIAERENELLQAWHVIKEGMNKRGIESLDRGEP